MGAAHERGVGEEQHESSAKDPQHCAAFGWHAIGIGLITIAGSCPGRRILGIRGPCSSKPDCRGNPIGTAYPDGWDKAADINVQVLTHRVDTGIARPIK